MKTYGISHLIVSSSAHVGFFFQGEYPTNASFVSSFCGADFLISIVFACTPISYNRKQETRRADCLLT